MTTRFDKAYSVLNSALSVCENFCFLKREECDEIRDSLCDGLSYLEDEWQEEELAKVEQDIQESNDIDF